MAIKNKILFSGVAAVALLGIGTISAPLLQPGSAFAEPVKLQAQQVPSFADVVEKVSPAVVSVQVEIGERSQNRFGKRHRGPQGFDDLPRDHPLWKFFNKRFGENGHGQDHFGQRKRPRAMAQGSGFFISEDGYLVTNNHVVKDGVKFTIVDNNGNEYKARMIGTDPKTDLAVLKVDSDQKFTYAAFSEAEVRSGEWVVAVGNPFGLGGTVTAGIVSARGRDIGAGPYDDFLQIDAAVNKGNSGGPTFALDGSVVGVNTAIYSPSGGNVGIAFAVPAKLAKSVTDDLIKNGSVVRGWLGVQIQPVTNDMAEALGLEKPRGAIVVEPAEDGPAAKAGLEAGDVILKVSDKRIKGPKKLASVIASFEPNQSVEVVILRNGKKQTVNVKLGQLPGTPINANFQKDADQAGATTSLEKLGIMVEKHDGDLIVADVDPESGAALKGIQPGTVILGVNGEKIDSVKDIEEKTSVAIKEGRKSILLQVEGRRGKRFVAVPIEQDNETNKG